MSKRVLSFLIVFVMFMTAAQIAAAQSDEVAIKKLIANFEKALNTGDADGVIDLFMPDGVFMPHGSPAQVGDKAIHAFYQDTLFRMGGRAVEGSSLENCRACKRTGGSNPSPSAI